MKNPKTSVVGYLVLAGVLIKVAIAALGAGEFPGFPEVMAAAAGVGLVFAKDGGR